MSKLKPCPFCGEEVYTRIGLMKLRFFVCPKCGSITSFDSDYYNKHPDLAVNAWNRRTTKENNND